MRKLELIRVIFFSFRFHEKFKKLNKNEKIHERLFWKKEKLFEMWEIENFSLKTIFFENGTAMPAGGNFDAWNENSFMIGGFAWIKMQLN